MPIFTKGESHANREYRRSCISVSAQKVVENQSFMFENTSRGYNSKRQAYDIGPEIKTLKLSMVLLVYLFSIDDEKISFFERRAFNKAISSIDAFSEGDRRELTGLLRMLPNASYVYQYIQRNHLSLAIVELAIKFLKEDVGINTKDRQLLNEFQSQYMALDQ